MAVAAVVLDLFAMLITLCARGAVFIAEITCKNRLGQGKLKGVEDLQRLTLLAGVQMSVATNTTLTAVLGARCPGFSVLRS